MSELENQAVEEEVETPDIPVEQRIDALENQLYIIYLQVNSISKLLIENETVSREDLLKEMNSLNGELYQLTQEVVKNSVPETE
jgi:hypothetical protein